MAEAAGVVVAVAGMGAEVAVEAATAAAARQAIVAAPSGTRTSDATAGAGTRFERHTCSLPPGQLANCGAGTHVGTGRFCGSAVPIYEPRNLGNFKSALRERAPLQRWHASHGTGDSEIHIFTASAASAPAGTVFSSSAVHAG